MCIRDRGQRLYPGEFTIEEVAPAPGFQLKEPTKQTVILHGGESKTVQFENVPLNAIIVEKYDLSLIHIFSPARLLSLWMGDSPKVEA